MKRRPQHQYIIYTQLGKQVTHKYSHSYNGVFQHFLESPFAQYLGTGFWDYKVSFYCSKEKYITTTCLEAVEDYYNEVIVPLSIKIEYEEEARREERYSMQILFTHKLP